MALSERVDIPPKLAPILEDVARQISRLGIKRGDASSAKAVLRVTLERNVDRIVQVYWTPFQASIPGTCIGLHLEVGEPRVHWGEAYVSPDYQNWVFYFGERESDGEIQLLYYFQESAADFADTIKGFFDHAGWYVLTATDTTWNDVVFEVAEDLPWSPQLEDRAARDLEPAVSEALKKGTIMWLRWKTADGVQQMPVWFVYDQKVQKIYVLSGERQQDLPGARSIRECDVILRWKGKNAAVAELRANVRVLTGTDPEWDEIADKVAEKRLNIPGLPEETAKRWRDECVILELTLP